LKLPAASGGESSIFKEENNYIRSLTPGQAPGNALAERFTAGRPRGYAAGNPVEGCTVMKKPLLFICLLAFLAPLVLGTSPVNRFHQYVIRGSVHRTGGGDESGFTVLIAGRSVYDSPGTYRILETQATPTNGEPEQPVDITDSTGSFRVAVTLHEKMDSLAVGLPGPDRPVYFGSPVSTRDMASVEARDYGTECTRCGCADCSSNPSAESWIAGFVYRLEDYSIIVP